MIPSEPVSEDELAKVMSTPEVKPKTTRSRKTLKRDWDSWFFGGMLHELGICEDPDCPDPRGKEQVMTATINGKRMCRFSYIGGYNE